MQIKINDLTFDLPMAMLKGAKPSQMRQIAGIEDTPEHVVYQMQQGVKTTLFEDQVVNLMLGTVFYIDGRSAFLKEPQ